MIRTLLTLTSIVVVSGVASAQFNRTFATPLPHGPGTVALPFPLAPLAAPVLMPVCAPTAAPVALYDYSVPGAHPADMAVPCADSCPRLWVGAEFLYGATKGVWVPPLLTRAPAGGTGALFTPGTVVAFGNERMGNDFRPGMRATAGYWFDPALRRGFDASLFFLGEYSEGLRATTGTSVLVRPLVNGLTGANIGQPIGAATASADTFVIGADVNYRRGLACGLDLLVGYRYAHLGDTVDVWTTGTPAGLTHDSFHSRNHFYGPQVGVASVRDLAACGLTLEFLAKIALGVTASEADVVGTSPVLAGPPIAGAYTATHFAAVPEVGTRLVYRLGERFRASTGYSLVYWSAVQRAAEQIDLTVLAPGRPGYRDRTTDLWMQGWTVGVEWRY